MNPKFMSASEREAYRMGYERGKQEGLQKAAMLIQLVASDIDGSRRMVREKTHRFVA